MSEESARASEEGADNKSIILFSDGTGNSSGKIFKTNVWRMYEAVDLGPAPPSKHNQISYYDDGVGTSAFKPLALLGGAFGWGLKRNVLDIYRYACRNYEPGPKRKKGTEAKHEEGDHIYGFGFSRGAFTMRVAIALIASQGLVSSEDERDLIRRSKDAYRAFRKDYLPRRLAAPTHLARWLRDKVIGAWRRVRGIPAYDKAKNHRPVIRFVGVWDTVSAYGGPIAELTRAIDNWIFPLSMPNYKLAQQVRCARHALALDDERDAFHPLLWDEVHEAGLVADGSVKAGRLEQVWFCGMHADVGGGYPDESLSYVSLLWMMEEAEAHGLRTLKVIKDRFVALANSFGPMHDSRSGIGAYYRYQPRKIEAWLEPVETATLSLRDPIIVHETRDPLIVKAPRVPKGLIYEAKVHESVIARIVSGTDRYAPITLPARMRIVPPQEAGENVPQADSVTPDAPPPGPVPRPLISAAQRARLELAEVSARRSEALEAVWDRVWRRRLAYFITVGLTLALVLMPLWVGSLPSPPFLSDGRTWIGGVIRLLALALPGFAEPWVETYANHAFYFLVISAAIVLLLVTSTSMDRRLRDSARAVWRQAAKVGGAMPRVPPPSRLQRIRNSRFYQRTIQVFKWALLPNLVLWPAMLLALVWLGAGFYTQARLPTLEAGGALCARTEGPLTELEARRVDFLPRSLCHPVGARVTAGQRYIVTFDVVDEWRDGGLDTSPTGIPAAGMTWLRGYLGVPFRRVMNANYLQPVLEIRPPREWWRPVDNVYIFPIELTQRGESRSLYRGEFVAPRSGELAVFANDAVLPFVSANMAPYDVSYFYERSGPDGQRGNAGSACVTIVRADRRGAIFADTSEGICGRADRRAAAAAAEAARAATSQ